MPDDTPRYFVTLPGAKGPRHFWQPSTKLRAKGFGSERLDDDKVKAIGRANELNAGVDAWRDGLAAAPGPARRAPDRRDGTLEALLEISSDRPSISSVLPPFSLVSA